MDVVITGVGLWSGLGNWQTSWQRLCRGETAIAPQTLFPELPSIPLALIAQRPQRLPALVQLTVQDALASSDLALPLTTCGVAIGSSRGAQGELEQLRQAPAQLSQWPDRLLATATNTAAGLLQSHGPVAAPMAACATGLWAIAQGYEWLRQGRCQQAIVGAVETPITPLTLASFKQMGALAPQGCYPFDRDRQGLVLGEGGAVFVLETRAQAQARQAPLYGVIRGFGFSTDAYHISAPDPEGKMAEQAILDCLRRSQLTPADIDYIHAHGTGTQRNDSQESQLIQRLWRSPVPISSTKGATGHTLGASGALGLAFSLLAMHEQRLPPCVGLRNPVVPLDYVYQAQAAIVEHCLVLSFGFGGQNAVVAVSRA
ncbi:MAG: beta-ketoacyl-ACP synthase [Cyanobacteria bacterium P01_G01_bin.54]